MQPTKGDRVIVREHGEYEGKEGTIRTIGIADAGYEYGIVTSDDGEMDELFPIAELEKVDTVK